MQMIWKKCTFMMVCIALSMSVVMNSYGAEENEVTQYVWKNISYGNGIRDNLNSFEGNAAKGKVTITANSGKIVPASKDGVAFHYTAIPSNLNFTLRAKVSVDSWTLTNGQEGFGIMATDQLGGSGWNNSYQVIASKMDFRWNKDTNSVTNSEKDSSVTNLIGIGVTEKKGVTSANIGKLEQGDTDTINQEFKSTRYPLEQRYPYKCNIIGNATNQNQIEGNIDNLITEFYLTIQKNNTGYFITYESIDGKYIQTKKYYEPVVLEQLDKKNVYIGFFASRTASATFSEITLKTIEPSRDEPAEQIPVEIVPVVATTLSQKYTGMELYQHVVYTNVDGILNIYRDSQKVIESVMVKGKEVLNVGETHLLKGNNSFTYEFIPSKKNILGPNQQLDTYEPIIWKRTVVYKTIPFEEIWTSPNGNGNGSKESPMNLAEAVKYAQPGQTIIMEEGTYQLGSKLNIERGNNGTKDQYIVLKADENAKTRPIIDGGRKSGTFSTSADYWYFKGFDVINSANGQCGMQIGGNNNVCEDIHTYHNGNTGLQISTTDNKYGKLGWPSDNRILNCTSYGNADAGYEDADGFAAKITCGTGNVFDGCIAHHNADDGWDFYAKVEYGSIGTVTIQNCIAYANGYLEDGTIAGNGNGFKMGGENLPAGHIIRNSIAFENKAGGIVSNSAPDIKIYNCTSVNNKGGNINLNSSYVNTDYVVKNTISFQTKYQNVNDSLSVKGNQKMEDIKNSSNYLWQNRISTNGKEAANEKWFATLDAAMVLDGVKSVGNFERNADGSILIGKLFQLTEAAAQNVGALFYTQEEYTGILFDETIGWCYIEEGRIAHDYTGLVYDEVYGWWYIEQGRITFGYNGFIEYNGSWWCIAGSTIAWQYTGLWYDETVGWWYVKNGAINFAYSGLVEYNAAWWCVTGGRVAFEYSGLWYDEIVGWWYVENGAINFAYDGLVEYNAAWWCVAGGRVTFEYTGLWYDKMVGWWYVENGAINFLYIGYVPYWENVYCVVNGQVIFG